MLINNHKIYSFIELEFLGNTMVEDMTDIDRYVLSSLPVSSTMVIHNVNVGFLG